MPGLVIITGPTAVGKTDASIRLASWWNTVIISCDSRQMYREMKIGTAVPTDLELSQVPHHFIGNLSVRDYYSVFRYEQEVLLLLPELFKKHELVIMSGGSGLYMDAVLNGVDDIPDPDPEVRMELKTRLAEEGLPALVEQLKDLDPVFHAKVDRNNPARVIRGLEVCLTTGRPFSEFRKGSSIARSFRITLVGLELPREELYERINRRVDKMIGAGLVEEARSLYPLRHLAALNTVGYKELFSYFDGETSLEEAVRLIKRNSRHYAKRQITWNNRYRNIRHFHPEQTDRIIDYVNGLTAGQDKTPR